MKFAKRYELASYGKNLSMLLATIDLTLLEALYSPQLLKVLTMLHPLFISVYKCDFLMQE